MHKADSIGETNPSAVVVAEIKVAKVGQARLSIPAGGSLAIDAAEDEDILAWTSIHLDTLFIRREPGAPAQIHHIITEAAIDAQEGTGADQQIVAIASIHLLKSLQTAGRAAPDRRG